MRRPRPSMMGLRALEAAARHMSFTAAARDLCLTQGAISRQIKLLEEMLDTTLFSRNRNHLALTREGEEFLREVRVALDRIDAAVSRVTTRCPKENHLDLAVGPAFGARWLMPKFPAFEATHPEITVTVFSRPNPIDFANEPFDAAIHYGTSLQEGTCGDRLVAEDLVPVCSPNLTGFSRLCDEPERIGDFKLMHLASRDRAWSEWLTATGYRHADAVAGPRFEQLLVLTEAVRAGMGLALVPRYVIANELVQSQLAIPIDAKFSSTWAYWFVYPATSRPKRALLHFKSWLLSVAAQQC